MATNFDLVQYALVEQLRRSLYLPLQNELTSLLVLISGVVVVAIVTVFKTTIIIIVLRRVIIVDRHGSVGVMSVIIDVF